MPPSEVQRCRYFLKDSIRQTVDFSQTDQSKGVPAPPIQKPPPDDAERIDLPAVGRWENVGRVDLALAVAGRCSHRSFRRDGLTLDELSFLLWATQGVRERRQGGTAMRTVPSAGCRHAMETYLCVLNVPGLDVGLYRYLPLEHRLAVEYRDERIAAKLVEATLGQTFAGTAAVTFVWSAVPYRMEWRYGLASHKVIALDAGHVCQNLYLACEAIGAGTCAIAAYDQEKMDRLLKADGEDEFTLYLAPVGKV